ncbi:MAG: hypothetical protein GQ538_04625, partial [Xanthomonadales bacterium]|nr:hypothetical protein [Xanthomonadales bacterium]
MNNISKKLKTLSITALLICSTGVSQTAYADIGLPDTPLFLGTAVPPNIFFGIDDSGSMAFGFLVEGVDSGRFDLGGNTQYRIPYPINQESSHADDRIPSEEFLNRVIASAGGTLYDAARVAQATSDLLEIWRAWTFAHNTMFYNPATTYIFWPSGEDIDGNSYADAVTTAARIDPYKPADGTVDLTTNYADYETDWDGVFWNNGGAGVNAELLIDGYHPAMYYAWNDTNVTTPGDAGNGVVDIDDVHTKVEIKPATATYSTDGGLTDRSGRNDCAAVPVCSYAEEVQNFANWFSYYRTREYVMKRAISDLIDDSVSYMGLATLHDNASVGTAIEDMTVQADKDTLLDELFQVNSSGGTPLPTLMRNIGRYFDDTNSNSHSDLGFTDASPILSSAQGGECQQNFNVLLTDGFWNGTPPAVDDSDDNADGDD